MTSLQPSDVLRHPTISRLDEGDRTLPVFLIRIDSSRTRRSRKVVPRREEHDRRRVSGYDVLQEEEVGVSLEILEQREELPVADERLSQGTRFAKVVQAYALQGQVEAVSDLRIAPALLIDRPLTVPLPPREHDPATHLASQGAELLSLRLRDFCEQLRHPHPPGPSRYR